MSNLNPYASPGHVEVETPLGPEPRLGNVVANTGRVFLRQWTTILIAVMLVSFPWELFLCYAIEHWFGEEDIWQKFFLAMLGEFTILIVARGLCLAAASLQLHGREASLPIVASYALAAFPALFICELISTIVVLVGCLFAVIPGIYLSIRWMYYGAAAVSEDLSGIRPLQRSWQLTTGRLMFSVAVFFLFLLPTTLLGIGLEVLVEFSPTLQFWLLTAAVNTVGDFLGLFVAIGFVAAYYELISRPPEPKPQA